VLDHVLDPANQQEFTTCTKSGGQEEKRILRSLGNGLGLLGEWVYSTPIF
jgi:hypothetical protein